MKNKERVVVYCRVSTDNQKDEGTIDLQVDAINDYCKSNNLEQIEVFKDEGVSGGLEVRPALADLLTFIEDPNNAITAIVIYKLDRLARDLIIQENLIRDFDKRGVRLLSTKETDLESKDPTRILMRQFLGGISQYEKALITMRLSGGRLRKAKKGGYAGGRIPLGYLCQDSELKQATDEIKAVRAILKMKRKRLSLNEIARRLNAEQIPTKRGGKWFASTVSYIVKNPIYRGRYKYSGIKQLRNDLTIL